ncbi:hypothetical protein QUF76_17020, partial [Desulfobacterales bacterium HSG16]|nr:hypothetical protein [Desulfobacterales bacterium HSG16]
MLQSVEEVGFERGWEEGQEYGWEKAWEKAWEKSRVEFAKNLIRNSSMSKKEIAMNTGLDLKKINELAKEIKREK